MKQKAFGILTFSFILVFTLSGCGSDSSSGGSSNGEGNSEGGELRVALEAEPQTLDPVFTPSSPTRDVDRQMYETLVTLNEDNEPTPMLADSWDESDDGKEYTFHLREGVKFHNGDEMTADDVVASMDQWLAKSSTASNVLGDDASFEEEDDYTVTLTLDEPTISTLYAMASNFPAIMPEDTTDESDEVDEFIGTGPFEFEEQKEDQYIHLKKFDDYEPVDDSPSGYAGKKEAKVDDVYFDIVTDPTTRKSGLQTGEYDIAQSLDYDSFEELDSDPDIQTKLPVNFELALVYNTKDGVMEDRKMRQAVNSALDPDKIMKASFADDKFYNLYGGYMGEDIKDWESDSFEDGYNIADTEKAKELLDESDYDGEEVTLLTTKSDLYQYKSAVEEKDQLDNIGMKVNIEEYEEATYDDIREDPENWDLMTAGLGLRLTPTQLLTLDNDWPGWPEDSEMDDALDEIEHTTDQNEAADRWDDLQEYLATDYVPASEIGEYSLVQAAREDVDGFNEFKGSPVLWNVSVDE